MYFNIKFYVNMILPAFTAVVKRVTIFAVQACYYEMTLMS